MKSYRIGQVFLGALTFVLIALTPVLSDHHENHVESESHDHQNCTEGSHQDEQRSKRSSDSGPLDFYTQWAKIKEMENILLRTHMAQLARACHHEPPESRGRSLGTRDIHTVPSAPFSGRPLGPYDIHIVPPAPGSRPNRPLGPHDIHIVPPAPSSRPNNQRPLGPHDFHIVPPAPGPRPNNKRPLSPHDIHIVPPAPGPRPRPLGPHDIHVVPPGPSWQHQERPRPLGPYDIHIVPPAPSTTRRPHQRPLGPHDLHIVPPAPSSGHHRKGDSFGRPSIGYDSYGATSSEIGALEIRERRSLIEDDSSEITKQNMAIFAALAKKNNQAI